ncbi:MAG: UDP-3-O-(3-hydroxymyristoyl)glucosamine N-acyltransferase [Chitinophagaceae bacterium]|nr:UDP-3-O-(3-hydroxymyristoyl)glucosamine N-acyltransferase [Chitinophagaceae bacterium]
MRFSAPVPLQELARLIKANLIGNTQASATGINELNRVEKGDLAFVDHPKYYEKCINSAASFIIINKKLDFPKEKALLIVENPFEAYLAIVDHYRPFRPSTKMISDTSTIGEGTVIMPNSYIGNHVTIGKNCIIHPNTTILDYTSIGDRVVIQSGTVIGSDAFYYNKKTDRKSHYKKMTSCGGVNIQDDVEIGAGCTIDRGVTSDTLIGAGTKMDNLVHIGHDTLIGSNCLFAAQVGIAGATTIEDNVILWGQVGVSKTLTIGEGATVYAQSGVKDSIAGKKVYFGSPVEDAREKMKELVWIKRIPELWEKVMGRKNQ